MGTYPDQYSRPAIIVAEEAVRLAVRDRLMNMNWIWGSPDYFLRGEEVEAIKQRFVPGVDIEEVVRFVGLVFSKVAPEIHYQFTSDGYTLGVGTYRNELVVVVKELPPCSHGYEQPGRDGCYQAALRAIRALLSWKLISYRRVHDEDWPIGEWGGADIIHGELYRWIKAIGEFKYCRTKDVIEFIRAAVPELFEQWDRNNLVLTPVYHVGRGGRDRFTTLRLVQKSPA